MAGVTRFHWADYLVLSAFMVMSALIGVFIGFKDRKKMTSKNFFTGGGDMHWGLVAFSMQASFLSSIFLLSMPVEVYAWGSMHYYLVFSFLIGITFSGCFVMPIFYNLQLISAYEYLEIRFNKLVRTACSLCFFLQTFLYMSVVLYTPALALAQVSGMSVSLSIVVCGLVCTFYTVIGGLKATIWNDFIQIIIIAVALVILLVLSLGKIGGFNNMWQINDRGGRIDFDDFRADPRLRTTFWTQVIGGVFVQLSMFASNQTSIQKFSGVGTLKGAKKASILCGISIALLFTMVCITGLASHALYFDCDPLVEGRIRKYDQIIPLFVMDVMGHLPGLPGLFIAAVLSAGLSSLSGNLNALTAVSLTDFINPIFEMFTGRHLDENIRALLSRGLTLVYGFLIVGMGFAAQYFGEVVVQVAFSIFGFVGGPLTSTIICGMFLPFLNSSGALTGLITSLLVSSWIAVGALFNKVPRAMLPVGENCSLTNITMSIVVASTVGINTESFVMNFYKISHMYYGLVALIVFLVVAIPVSLVTGRTQTVESKVIIDWFDQCCCCLPSTFKRFFRCGTELTEKEEDIKPEIVSQSVNSFINEFIERHEMSVRVEYPSNQDLSTYNLPPYDQEPSKVQNGMEGDDTDIGENITIPDKQVVPEDDPTFRRPVVPESHVKTDDDVTGF